MAGLKELRTRIETIKSTQKITSAMKMVAASRLRRSQGLISKCSFYHNNLLSCANRVIYELQEEENNTGTAVNYPKLMTGTGKDKTYLLLVFTSDRGLCGSYNANVAKVAIARIEELLSQDKEVKVVCVGKKGRDIIKRKYADLIVNTIEGVAKKGAKYYEGTDIAYPVLEAYEKGEIDVCEVVVSHFRSAINREVKCKQLLPMKMENFDNTNRLNFRTNVVRGAFYEYEPGKLELLSGMLPLIFRESVFQAIVHSQASEHGARMTSMDNATRNAKDMISKLTLKYNGIRQSAITTELIEIISGAEAL